PKPSPGCGRPGWPNAWPGGGRGRWREPDVAPGRRPGGPPGRGRHRPAPRPRPVARRADRRRGSTAGRSRRPRPRRRVRSGPPRRGPVPEGRRGARRRPRPGGGGAGPGPGGGGAAAFGVRPAARRRAVAHRPAGRRQHRHRRRSRAPAGPLPGTAGPRRHGRRRGRAAGLRRRVAPLPRPAGAGRPLRALVPLGRRRRRRHRPPGGPGRPRAPPPAADPRGGPVVRSSPVTAAVDRFTTDPDLPLRQGAFQSPLRDERIAAWLGAALGLLFTTCFVTGLFSHLHQHPLSWLPVPARPAGLYRFAQGLHVASGIASLPVLVAKLWVVWPRFLSFPPGRRAADAVERLGVLALVTGGIFMVFSGVANIAQWYPWRFSFTAAHYWTAWITAGALVAHAGAKA